MPSPIQALHSRFEDFDQLAEAIAGWELEWRQLDGGRLEADLLQLGHASAVLARVEFSRRFFQSGGTPPGMRTFGLIGSGTSPMSWCGREIDDQMILPFAGDYESASQPGFRAATLSFTEATLESAARRLGTDDSLWRDSQSGMPLRCDAAAVDALRQRLRQVFRGVESKPDLAKTSGFLRELESEIPVQLLRVLATARRSEPRRSGPPSNRDRIARQARNYIEEHLDEPPTIEEVCQHVGVSLRALEYAFREHVGVTPKRYLQAIRLQAVRRALHAATTGTSVASVANRWGFWHMGQFAADYRRLFGELPSETLRRTE